MLSLRESEDFLAHYASGCALLMDLLPGAHGQYGHCWRPCSVNVGASVAMQKTRGSMGNMGNMGNPVFNR
jgi:hypothetical protein